MDIYTVLLVDDEEEVIQVIMKKINWEGLGFSVIGYACNGVKALELVEEYQPDVVITDIKMPYMDGIELSNHIKAEFPMTKLLFFTGFDEFEYAREAIHLEVEEYILKPVNSRELTDIFSKLKTKLDQEISEKQNAEILQKYYMESLPILQANFYSGLIEGRIQKDEISRYLSDYQISVAGPYFCCLVIHTSKSQVPEKLNPLLVSASVQKQAKERLGEKWQVKCFPYLGNTVLIAQLKSEQEISELTDECDRFCRYIRHFLGAVVTVGIGSVCRKINSQGMANGAELLELFKTIPLGASEDIVQAVDQYLRRMSFSQKTLQQYHIDVMELISALYRFSENHDIVSEELSGNMGMLYSGLLDLEPEALRNWLIRVSLSFREALIHVRSRSARSFLSRAKEYVQNNYGDEELSLDSVCQALGVSNSYFSTIFKKKTGNSFIGYLTDYRMDQASRLLIETDEKSYVIAKQVGYTDPNYFSYVFKKRFGMSPTRYRTEHMEREK